MSAHITRKTSNYYLVVDELHYRVRHDIWRIPTGPHEGETREEWGVVSSKGVHAYAHHCDPDKPTHKRVVAALKSVLTEAELTL